MVLRDLVQDGKGANVARTEGGRKKVVRDQVSESKAGPVHRRPYKLL